MSNPDSVSRLLQSSRRAELISLLNIDATLADPPTTSKSITHARPSLLSTSPTTSMATRRQACARSAGALSPTERLSKITSARSARLPRAASGRSFKFSLTHFAGPQAAQSSAAAAAKMMVMTMMMMSQKMMRKETPKHAGPLLRAQSARLARLNFEAKTLSAAESTLLSLSASQRLSVSYPTRVSSPPREPYQTSKPQLLVLSPHRRRWVHRPTGITHMIPVRVPRRQSLVVIRGRLARWSAGPASLLFGVVRKTRHLLW